MLSDTALFKMTRESFDYRKDGMVYVAKWTKERATTSQFVKVLIDGKAVYEEELCETGNEKGQNAAIFLTLQQDQIITDCESKNYCESSQKVQNLSYNEIRCIASTKKMFDAINATHQKIGHVNEKRHFEKPRINGKRQTGNVPFVFHIL
ncbi:hypothetical protein T4C_9720 [Trichinella pseudospiralis]|uniref:Uncharacterized protein n=1 Tax=Trichinella pseudospiralis TaxID=6337 RepID=A0A0V1J647_TRIPS|nr:hypothetical protein T4C_9720 [Trichinella pseudospiralis]